MAVLDPIRVVIENYPEGKEETFAVANNPVDAEAGTREVVFTRECYIERTDFAEVPPPKFQRLKPGGEVRLMGAYIVKCNEVVKDADGATSPSCAAPPTLKRPTACPPTAARCAAPSTGSPPRTPATRA